MGSRIRGRERDGGRERELSGATQGNPRADSDEETGMIEPKYLLHRETWSADPGKLG